METVDVQKSLPSKFEPLRVNRWVMMMEGIDAFLVKAVELPTIEPGASSRVLLVALHNVVGGNQNERLKAWLESPTMKGGELKFLDPVGIVVERWMFQAKPMKMWFDKLDYACSNTLATYLQVEVINFEITAS